MKKILFSYLTIAFILTGCKSEFKEFSDQALFYAKDGTIDQKEYEHLLNLIESSDDIGFKNFKSDDGLLDNSKVEKYLLKLFCAKNISITSNGIYHPQRSSVDRKQFNVNVFLENSGSMNGYMNDPNTSFKNSIYSLLTRLKLLTLSDSLKGSDSLNLYLINQTNQQLFSDASNNDLEKFKDILNPTDFAKLSKGKTGISDLNDLVKRCLENTNEHNLSVFISDCIYSPGKNVNDAAKYLSEQKQGIYLNFATRLKNENIAVIILQLTGNFQGTYFNRYDAAIQIKNSLKRPFYIWFLGTEDQIRTILDRKIIEEIDGGVENKVVLNKISSITSPNFKILSPHPKFGNFDRTEIAKKIITNASMGVDGSDRKIFEFSIAVDFALSMQDMDFFLDTSIYKISNPSYRISIDKLNNNNSNISTNGFTHLIKLSTNELREETLKIDIRRRIPSWIQESTSSDDCNIVVVDSIQQKTFGLRYLIEGVYDAYYPKSLSNIESSISIIIKKQ